MVKQYDKGTVLIFTVKDSYGNIVNLSEAVSASLVFRAGGVTTTKNCDFHDRPNGKVKYVIAENDLSTPGTIHFEVVISFGEDRQFTSKRITDFIEEKL